LKTKTQTVYEKILILLALTAAGIPIAIGALILILYWDENRHGALIVSLPFFAISLLALACLKTDKCPPLTY